VGVNGQVAMRTAKPCATWGGRGTASGFKRGRKNVPVLFYFRYHRRTLWKAFSGPGCSGWKEALLHPKGKGREELVRMIPSRETTEVLLHRGKEKTYKNEESEKERLGWGGPADW